MKLLKYKKRNLVIWLIFLFILVLAGERALILDSGSGLFAESIAKKADRGKDINILIIGIDARPGEKTARRILFYVVV